MLLSAFARFALPAIVGSAFSLAAAAPGFAQVVAGEGIGAGAETAAGTTPRVMPEGPQTDGQNKTTAAKAQTAVDADVQAVAEAARLAQEKAARIAAEVDTTRLATEEAARIRAEGLLAQCMDIAGAPSAEVAISEDAQRAVFRALATARAACADAAEALPQEGGPLFHLATIAQATGEHRQAVALYERAAEAGVAAASTRLGDYYNFGIRPIREDLARAVAYYTAATEAGDPAGAATLALMHRLGRGVPRDPARMVALLRIAADADYHFAQYRLAQVYLNGEGIPGGADAALGIPDPQAAVPLLAGAAQAGNFDAALELADLYDTGAAGIPADPSLRYRWVNLAAEAGLPKAIALRAFLTERGIGTAPDPAFAAAQYVRAIETGEVDPDSMRGTVNGRVPAWERETARTFQQILQERGLYNGPIDAIIGQGTLRGARALAN